MTFSSTSTSSSFSLILMAEFNTCEILISDISENKDSLERLFPDSYVICVL